MSLTILESVNYTSQHLQARFWLYSVLGTLGALIAGYLIATQGMIGSVVAVIIPALLAVVVGVLLEPKLGLFICLQISFLIGATRDLPVNAPVGITVDGILILTMLSLFVNGHRMYWKRLHRPVFYLVALWFFYNLLELFNPEAPYRAAWIFRVRAYSLQWLFLTIIILVNPISRQDIRILLRSWLFWSFLAALWAFKQQYIGLTVGEQNWLDAFGGKTHILFGKLRSFSFYSDASQFGAEMAGVTLVCLILLLEEKTWLRKLGYVFLVLFYFWGYAVSGTRSALFVLLAGFPLYLFLKRDFGKILLSACLAAPLFFILMFTNLGNENYQIYRIRTALHPSEDASFNLRLANQQKLARNMEGFPFGAGLGTAAEAGYRFSPDHWAASIAPDSWYVLLWIETGIVGVWLYVAILMVLVGIGIYKVWRLEDPWLTKIMLAFLAEFVGIAIMGYSNPVLGQFPTSTIIFIASVLFTTCEQWDEPADAQRPKKRKVALAESHW